MAIDKETLEQFEIAKNHKDFVCGALMADAHLGYSLPIGGVIGLKETIVPAWVGYDIGCGMTNVLLSNVTNNDIALNKEEIFNQIYENIPCGVGAGNKKPEPHKLNFKKTQAPQLLRHLISEQLGTLGAGNHFIEIGENKIGEIFLTIHSGSRGVGAKIAGLYMSFDKENEGFKITSGIGSQYLEDMRFCLEFALENRKVMVERVLTVLRRILKKEVKGINLINRNHNHAELAHNLVIHRKGATHAEKGMHGVIPANMKDGVFIVKGLGSEKFLWSSSHGAGRVCSREEIKKSISMNDFIKSMEGIKAKVEISTLDESCFAYKNIYEVIEEQVLNKQIEVLFQITPLINIKG